MKSNGRGSARSVGRVVAVAVAITLLFVGALLTLLPAGQRGSVWTWTDRQNNGMSVDEQLAEERECLDLRAEWGFDEEAARETCLDLVIGLSFDDVPAPWSDEAVQGNLPVLVPAAALVLSGVATLAVVVLTRRRG